eukprot:5342736-Amphidinium_carterae.1
MSDKEGHSNDITWPKDTIQARPHVHEHNKGKVHAAQGTDMGKMFACRRKEGGQGGVGGTARPQRRSKHKVLEKKRQEVGVELRACESHVAAESPAIPNGRR